MTELMTRIWNDDSGQDMAEYAIVLGLIAVVAYAAVETLGTSISTMFTNISNAINKAGS